MSGFGCFARMARKTALALVSGLLLPAIALAQPAGIDPQAEKLLKAATDFLAGQKQFSVDTRNSLEVVLNSGQKIEFNHTGRQSVQRPNKLRAERTGDLVNQVVYYDGKSFTLHNPGDKVYATVTAPATLEETLDFARTSLEIIAPAGDLVYKNAYEILMTDVSQAFVVGKAVIEGARCDHLAFRAPHVDMQVWIQEGKEPLIRKIVLTTRDVVNAPQFSLVVTKWNLQPQLTDKTFSFAPPKDAKKIDFLPMGKK